MYLYYFIHTYTYCTCLMAEKKRLITRFQVNYFLLLCENSGISSGIFNASVFVRWIVLTKALTCLTVVKCKWKVGFRLILKLFSLKTNDVTLSSYSHVIHHIESASTHFHTYLTYFMCTSNFPKDVCIIEETLK